MPEKLSPYFAVFNGHVNEADKRARAFLAENSLTTWLEEIKAMEAKENGIMALFNHEPTAATGAYVALVTLFVNEGRT